MPLQLLGRPLGPAAALRRIPAERLRDQSAPERLLHEDRGVAEGVNAGRELGISVRHHSDHPPARRSASRRMTYIVPTVIAAFRSFQLTIIVEKKTRYSQ